MATGLIYGGLHPTRNGDASLATLAVAVTVAEDPVTDFNSLINELVGALGRLRMGFEPRAAGRLVEVRDGVEPVEVGRVLLWEPGRRAVLEWRAADWAPDERTEIEIRSEPTEDGTRLTIEHRGWGALVRNRGAGELVGWFADEVVGPLFRATAPTRFGDWLTDRSARRPSGPVARAVYRDPLYHRPNFRAILDTLALRSDDYLFEFGCGGGALLQEALRSGCRAAAVDHSEEMVGVAREENRDAIAAGRLEVVHAGDERIPFPDSVFTCAAMTGVFAFLPDPVSTMVEIRRVLVPGGRLAVFTSSRELRGTPAAPEPIAGRLRFYEEEELARIGREAGFVDVRVERPDLLPFARAVGVPEEHLALFKGSAGQLLLGRKR